jgi:hypothetical protein
LAIFNWENNTTNLNNLRQNSPYIKKFPGLENVTREGLQVFGLQVAGSEESLNLYQQNVLRTLAGAGTFTQPFIEELFGHIKTSLTGTDAQKAKSLGKISKSISKVSKRLQSELSPKSLSFTEEEIQSALGITNVGQTVYKYSPEELLLRVAGKDTSLTPLEKVFVSASGGRQRTGAFLTQGEALENILTTSGFYSALGEDLDTQNISGFLKEDLEEAVRRKSGGRTESVMELLKEISAGRTAVPEYSEMIGRLGDNLETYADGAYVYNKPAMMRLAKFKRTQFKNRKEELELRGNISTEELQELRELETEAVNAEQFALTGTSAPSRFVTGAGTAKGEAVAEDVVQNIAGINVGKMKARVKQLEGYTKLSKSQQEELEIMRVYLAAHEEGEKYLAFMPESALKKEVGSIPGITLDVSGGGESIVYTNTMGIMSDPELYSNPELMARIEQNVVQHKAQIDQALETGILPEDFKKSILTQAEAFGLVEGTPGSINLTLLSPEARAKLERRRLHIAQLHRGIMQNEDPRRIPGLMNEMVTYYGTEVAREKQGEAALAIPDMTRVKLRTYESQLTTAPTRANLQGHSVIETRYGKIPFVSFTSNKKIITISGTNAAIYKASEGTFDLDDTGLALMQTFKDDEGRTRIGFTLKRDPQGPEESLLLRPEFGDARTLQGLVGEASNPNAAHMFFQQELNPEIIEELRRQGVDEETGRQVFEDMQQALNIRKGKYTNKGGRNISFVNTEEEEVASETFLRLAAEQRLGGTSLPEFNSSILEQAARLQSASVRGRNVIRNGQTVQVLENLTAEKGAQYTAGNFVELGIETDVPEVASQFKDVLREELNLQGITATESQLEGFLTGTAIPGVNTEAMQQTVFQKLSTKLGIENIKPAEGSIGAASNRTSVVAHLSLQTQEVMNNLRLTADSATSAYLNRLEAGYGAGIIPPSDYVDLINQISSSKVVPLQEAIKGKSYLEQKKIVGAYRAIAQAVNDRNSEIDGATMVTARTLSNFTTADASAAALSAQSRFFGRTMGIQLANGESLNELVGIDPTILATRTRIPGDRGRIRANVEAGLQDAAADRSLTSAQRNAIRKHLAKLRSMSDKSFFETVAIKEGSKRFASVAGATTRIAQEAKAVNARVQSWETLTGKVSGQQVIVGHSAYRIQAQTLLQGEEMQGLFGKLKELKQIAVPSQEAQINISAIQIDINERLMQGVAAIQESHPTGTGSILDIVDTLQSEMVKIHGKQSLSIMDAMRTRRHRAYWHNSSFISWK